MNDDLIDSTDFLPTICEAAGAKVPASLTDRRPQLPAAAHGRKGPAARMDLHVVLQERRAAVPRVRDRHKQYKLYRNGRFFDLRNDPFEDQPPQALADLNGAEAEAAAKLKAVLAQYADARPAELQKSAAARRKERRQKRQPAKIADKPRKDDE